MKDENILAELEELERQGKIIRGQDPYTFRLAYPYNCKSKINKVSKISKEERDILLSK